MSPELEEQVLVTFIPLANLAPWLPGGSDGKESACKAGDPGLIPGSERSSGEGNSYPRQYSCLENSMDRGTWQAAVQRVAESGGMTNTWNFFFTLLRIGCNQCIIN